MDKIDELIDKSQYDYEFNDDTMPFRESRLRANGFIMIHSEQDRRNELGILVQMEGKDKGDIWKCKGRNHIERCDNIGNIYRGLKSRYKKEPYTYDENFHAGIRSAKRLMKKWR